MSALAIAALAAIPPAVLNDPQASGPYSVLQRDDSARLLFAEFYDTVAGGTQTTSQALAADFDGDGDTDLYLMGAFNEPHQLLLNEGHGSFREAADAPPVSPFASPGAAADFDGDGDVDLLVGLGLFLNDGAGAFVDASEQVSAVLPQFSSLTATGVGDVDGDGDLDLWLGLTVFGEPQIDVLLLNDGQASFGPGGSIPAVAARSRDIAFGDVDGDGDLDAVVATGVDDELEQEVDQTLLFLNDGAGNFSDATAALPVDDQNTSGVRLGDLDGDGDVDIVLANGLSGSHEFPSLEGNRVYLNDGMGGFTYAPAALPALLDGTTALALGDVDGDHDLDIWFGNSERPILPPLAPFLSVTTKASAGRLLLNDGSGHFSDTWTEATDMVRATRAGLLEDLDGDGDLDLFVANTGENDVLFGDGQGTFTALAGALPQRARNADRLAAVDLNGDGLVDLFAGRNLGGDDQTNNEVWLGDRTGRFERTSNALSSDYTVSASAVGDVDGDGDLDVLVGNTADGEFLPQPQDNHLYLNDGTGTLSDASAQLPMTLGDDRGLVEDVALADLDGDGDLDALLASSQDYDGGGGGVDVWTNDGGGTFSDTGYLSAPNTYQVHVLDVDSDGDNDVLTSSSFPLAELWLNDGEGNFSESPRDLPSAGQVGTPIFLEVADFDGDGLADCVGAAAISSEELYRFFWSGDGIGGFVEQNAPVGAAFDRALQAGDVDGDGDLDLVGDYALLFNDGEGTFRQSPIAHPGYLGGRLTAIVDVDRDGDLDLVSAGSPSRVWANLSRHLAWRSLPLLGADLTLSVHGPTDEAWLLLGASALLPTPLPTTNGLLQIDPTQLLVLNAGALNANGVAKVDFALPALPGLAGLSIWWQAAVGEGLRLTNLEETTLIGQ